MTEQTKRIDQEIQAETSRDGKYLTFSLGQEEYGVGILRVREIIGLIKVTEIPKMPDYVKGVINLRGKVSPIIDLRLKFSMESAKDTDRTCIILVETDKNNTTVLMGMVVDSVSEVMQLGAEEIENPPDVGGVDTDYIMGIAKKEDKVILLLDIDKVMNSGELAILESAA
jgi:purine-binding chemotaxis protein CheW